MLQRLLFLLSFLSHPSNMREYFSALTGSTEVHDKRNVDGPV